MTRFEQKPTPAMYLAVALSLVAVFLADIYTPLGTAVWVFYLISVKLALFGWRPVVPVVVAFLATVLIVVAYFLSPPGVELHIAILNRVIMVLTLWVATGIGYLFIRNKLVVRRQEWFQLGQTRLSERMGGDQHLTELGENVLRFLAEDLSMHTPQPCLSKTGAASAALPPTRCPPARRSPSVLSRERASWDRPSRIVGRSLPGRCRKAI